MFLLVFKEDLWDVKEYGRQCGMMILEKFIIEIVKKNLIFCLMIIQIFIILNYAIIQDIYHLI